MEASNFAHCVNMFCIDVSNLSILFKLKLHASTVCDNNFFYIPRNNKNNLYIF